MPIFFQHQINDTTRIGIWKIEESEDFFKANVPLHRDVTHPHKRLQHLAGRFLLQYLFPDFPYDLVRIADTRKPFLKGAKYHFSISHCGDYAAAIVSKDKRVGVDIEIPVEKILILKEKFLGPEELASIDVQDKEKVTLCWSVKEAVFKWFGDGGVDFRKHIQINALSEGKQEIQATFLKEEDRKLVIEFRLFDHLVLAWVITDIKP